MRKRDLGVSRPLLRSSGFLSQASTLSHSTSRPSLPARRRAIAWSTIVTFLLMLLVVLAVMSIFGSRILAAAKLAIGVETACDVSGKTAGDYELELQEILDGRPAVSYDRLPFSLYGEFEACFKERARLSALRGFEIVAPAELAYRDGKYLDSGMLFEDALRKYPVFYREDVEDRVVSAYLGAKSPERIPFVWYKALRDGSAVVDVVPFLRAMSRVSALPLHLDLAELLHPQGFVDGAFIAGNAFTVRQEGSRVDYFIYKGGGMWVWMITGTKGDIKLADRVVFSPEVYSVARSVPRDRLSPLEPPLRVVLPRKPAE